MRSRPALFGIGLPAVLILIASPWASSVSRPKLLRNGPRRPNNLVTTKSSNSRFPPNGVMETAWKVEWDTVMGFGLVIKNAWFKRGPKVTTGCRS